MHLTWLNLRVKATTFGAELCFSFLFQPQLDSSWKHTKEQGNWYHALKHSRFFCTPAFYWMCLTFRGHSVGSGEEADGVIWWGRKGRKKKRTRSSQRLRHINVWCKNKWIKRVFCFSEAQYSAHYWLKPSQHRTENQDTHWFLLKCRFMEKELKLKHSDEVINYLKVPVELFEHQWRYRVMLWECLYSLYLLICRQTVLTVDIVSFHSRKTTSVTNSINDNSVPINPRNTHT